MEDDEGNVTIKEESTMVNEGVAIHLSGPEQNIKVQEYLTRFSEFVNTNDTKNLLQSLFCDIPEGFFLDFPPEDQLDYIHKLDDCVKVIKIYAQTAEKNHRDKVENLDLEERVRLKKKDAQYKAKPREEDSIKRDKETKQMKLVKTLREAGFSEEDILRMTKS